MQHSNRSALKTSGAGQIKSVQMLRAFAALAVVAYHTTVLLHEHTTSSGAMPWTNGNAGVDLFFVISGFIMVLSSRRLLAQPGGWRQFIKLRAVRIVPMYWLATIVKLAVIFVAPSMAIKTKPILWNIVASFLFVPSRNDLGIVSPVLVVGWTLSFEMLFYVIFAVSLFFSLDPIVIVAPFMVALAIISCAKIEEWPAFATLADPIVLDFVFGVLIAQLFLSKKLQTISRPLSLIIGIVGLACLIFVPADGPWQRTGFWGLAASATLTAGLAAERWLDPYLPQWIVMIGEASYSLYLTHGFVLSVTGVLVTKAQLSVTLMGIILIPLCMIGSTIFALVVYRYVEDPLTSRLRKFAID